MSKIIYDTQEEFEKFLSIRSRAKTSSYSERREIIDSLEIECESILVSMSNDKDPASLAYKQREFDKLEALLESI